MIDQKYADEVFELIEKEYDRYYTKKYESPELVSHDMGRFGLPCYKEVIPDHPSLYVSDDVLYSLLRYRDSYLSVSMDMRGSRSRFRGMEVLVVKDKQMYVRIA